MKYTAALLALGAAVVSAQSDCVTSLDGAFSFQTANVTSSNKARSLEDLEKRQFPSCGSSVTLHLGGGVLNDARGRTGYTASNDQFQFDAPPQAGYKDVDGFSICTIGGNINNRRLALKGEQTFYNCLSGTFNNIYSTSQGDQCYEVYIQIFQCLPTSPIPSAPINTVPFPSGTLSSSPESATEAASGSSSESASETEVAPVSESPIPMTANPMTVTPSSAPVITPYPVGNSSTPAPTGSAPVTPGVTTPSTPSGTAPPTSSFTGAADILAVGKKLVGLAAGVAAFAMF